MKFIQNVKANTKPKYFTNYIIILVMLAVTLLMKMTGNRARSNMTLLAQISYSIILAVSLNLVVGFLGELSLGHAGFMCVGAYLGCYAANILHEYIASPLLVLIISMIIGGLIAAVFGFIIGLPALRLKGDYLAIVTLAFGEIVRTIFKNFKSFGGALGLDSRRYKGNLFIVGFIVILFTLFIIQNIVRSKHGRAITAVRDNEIAARAMGINVTYYKLFVFVVAAFFAGVAGVIYGHFASPVLYSFFSYNYSIEILVMVVLGGMGNITGSIIAATAITFINFQLQTRLSGDLAAVKFLVYALILIVVVVFNNAPKLAGIREKFSIKRLIKSKKHPSDIHDDEAAWDRVPTKIKMDEVLSVDIKVEDHYTPDKEDPTTKGGSK